MKPIEIETDAERLLIAIRRTGHPAWAVAQRAGINPPEISQFLSDVRPLSRVTCHALAKAVGVRVEHLFPDTLKQLTEAGK